MDNIKQDISILTLLLLASVASFGAVLPTPAILKIAHYFHQSTAQAESIISIYLLGYALGQLCYGPLANHFGRKQALRFGILLTLAGCMISIMATYFGLFEIYVIARLLIALGAASGMVVSMIIVKDSFDQVGARKALAKIVLSFAFVPFVAIALGGFIADHTNWQVINYVLLGYVASLLILIIRLPETLHPTKQIKITLRSLSNGYWKLAKHVKFLKIVALFMLSASVSYIFNSLAPVVAIKDMHISAQTYGWLSIIPSMGIFIGGYISNRFAENIKANVMIIYGVACVLLGGLLLTLFFLLSLVNLYALFSTAIFMFCGVALIIPNASMQALAQVEDHANGASVMNALSLIVCSLLVGIAGSMINSFSMVLPLAIAALGIVGTFILINLRELKFDEIIR